MVCLGIWFLDRYNDQNISQYDINGIFMKMSVSFKRKIQNLISCMIEELNQDVQNVWKIKVSYFYSFYKHVV